MAQRSAEGSALSAPRVLIVRFSAIGDCVMAAWAVSGLRQAAPEAHIVWAVQDRCADVIAAPALVNEVAIVDRTVWKKRRSDPRTWIAQLKAFSALRTHNFEFGFDLQGHSKTALCLKLSGAKQRFTNRGTDALAKRLNNFVECGVTQVHEAEAARRLLQKVTAFENPILPIMPDVAPVARRGVTIQTGSGHWKKAVAPEVWTEIGRGLIAEGIPVKIIGAQGDPVLDLPGSEDLVGQRDLVGSMKEIASSQVHLSADTGSAHIAAAYGVPTLTVFGWTDPVRYKPNFDRAVCFRPEGGPSAVDPAEVVAKVKQMIQEGA